MDGAKLNAKVQKGFSIAATRVGNPFQVYRLTVAGDDPIQPAYKVQDALPAAITVHSSGFNFERPTDAKSCLCHALIDGTKVQEGDILVDTTGGQGMFAIASMQPAMPTIAISCNRKLSVHRQRQIARLPENFAAVYRGVSAETRDDDPFTGMVRFVQAVPCSILYKAVIRRRNEGLPGDVSSPGAWEVYMAKVFGVADHGIAEHDICIDDIGRYFQIEESERNQTGWRLRVRYLKG